MLLRLRLAELNADIILSDDEKSAWKAREEYLAITYFAEWLTQLGQKQQQRGMNLEIDRGGE